MVQDTIRIGTLVPRDNTGNYIKQILPHGFESFEITFGGSVKGIDLAKHSADVKKALEGSDAIISCLGCYGNPLMDTDGARDTRESWEKIIDNAHLYGCNLITGFTGRVVGKPIDASIDRYKEVFGPLAKRAADKGVRIAFENCDMGGVWHHGDHNIAHFPAAWELMFNAFDSENVGLEWEPCHQMVKLIDPMAQLRKWVGKIFHLHGKDASIHWDVIREYGITGPKPWAFHRTPGFGDCNWTDIISELRRGGFKGCIDIEGWHDPVYRGELEMTGQVAGLNYLKTCRTTFVANPK